MRFNYLNWVIATALILTVFSVAIIAIGYQPLSPLRALTVVALLAVAGAAWVVKRRKSGERSGRHRGRSGPAAPART